MNAGQTIALIGTPNCGKTTIFNLLTGTRQKTGNWPGVTVEQKTGIWKMPTQDAQLIDLPGIYSLEQEAEGLDERIARDYLVSSQNDVIINIIDATQLERQLLLTSQLRELGIPMLVVITMLDVARQQNITINFDKLSKYLKVPVVGIDIIQNTGKEQLEHALTQLKTIKVRPMTMPNAADRIVARNKQIRMWLRHAVTGGANQYTLTNRIDNIVLHPVAGIPVFLLVMYLLFTFAINLGSVFIDFFDILVGGLLVDGGHALLGALNSPQWLATLLADGVGGGIQLVATFIPVIAFLYIGLSILESSGYIMRAAFIVDRFMSAVGLPGKSFVPLIVGFGCNVPSVMATRTLNNPADRLVTIAMTPFMSCGARLQVYALFAVAFFPEGGQNMVFALYLLGIAMAMLTGWLFRKSFPRSASNISLMEMPAYHIPRPGNVMRNVWHRLHGFVVRAGRTILLAVILLTFINSWGMDGSFGNQDSSSSVLSVMSQKITPLLAPMGVSQDNWPATVGIFTGVLAKEAVVGTFDALYTSISQPDSVEEVRVFDLSASAWTAIVSVWDNALGLLDNLTDPLGIRLTQYRSLSEAADDQTVSETTFTSMISLFGSQFNAFVYLVFILLYTPCAAMIGALVRESGWFWASVVSSWSTILAYSVAVIVYQTGTLLLHPLGSILWVLAMLCILAVFLHLLKRLVYRKGKHTDDNTIKVLQI